MEAPPLLPERLMPDPWFRAQGRAYGMEMALGTYGARVRSAPLGDGERALGWLVLPDFQRPPVWTEAQQVRFIESAWGGLPLGVWVYNRADRNDSPFDCWLLDGQQRVTACYQYVNDAFPVLGYRFSELSERERRRFMMIPFSAMETCVEDVDLLREIYDRLAYGGTPHEPKA